VSYGDLTSAEQAHWNEYTNLRQLSDWPGFSDGQRQRRTDSRAWLVERRKSIWRSAQPKSKGGDGKGWNVANRRTRWEFLKDANLNTGAPKHEVRLPAPGAMTQTERVYVEEREVYLVFTSTSDAQKARKVANVDWLVNRRKQLYRLLRDEPNKMARERKARYDALCIATGHGKVFTEWKKTHNKWGVPIKTEPTTGRAVAVSNARKHLGVKENPANSNRGEPQPSGWQRRVFGSTGVPWCACFTSCMAWDAGVEGSATAAVSVACSMARAGKGIYRGATRDPSRVRRGDHAVIGCESCHIEMVISDTDPYHTIGGNTSPGAGGSQYNGGGVFERHRRGQVVLWLLVRF